MTPFSYVFYDVLDVHCLSEECSFNTVLTLREREGKKKLDCMSKMKIDHYCMKNLKFETNLT